ncbi:MAG: DNA polymerase III subunit delta [Candidatus Delongbacteria bacterium]|nr:DNA polymerase III subunit delta [Candidatus Delongbacteria bacterium]
MAKTSTNIDPSKHTIYLLTGEDRYSIEQKVVEIISHYMDEDLKDFNFNHFNEENVSPESISLALFSLPVMADKRVVYISDIDKANSEVTDLLLKFLQKNIDTTILILTGVKPDKRKVFFKEITKNPNSFSQEFKQKNEKEIMQWMSNYISSKGMKISHKGLMLLSISISAQLSNIASEIDKLIEYTSGSEITEDTIEDVLGISKEFNIFKLQTSVVEKKLSVALNICDNIIRSKSSNKMDPIGINLFLSRIFISAFEISYVALTNRISIDSAAKKQGYNNPWRDADTITCAKNYKAAELIRILRYLLECDIKLKSSYQDPKTAVFVLLEKVIKHGEDKECEYLEYFDTLRA